MARTLIAVALTLLTLPLAASAPPVRTADELGMSTDRLKRINQMMRWAIEAKDISGGVTAVARFGGIAHLEAHGLMDIESNREMRKDAIFRIASMSKPVTGVAILMLMEEGLLRLTDPVARFIPEFKETKVAVAPEGGEPPAPGATQAPAVAMSTVPSTRDITIRDLLTHTSGLQSGGAGSREAGRIARRTSTDTLATYVPRFGVAPLDFQPGTRWRYSALAGMDTLGRVVEVASGQPFDVFLRTRIFEPLGMKDTTFVPDANRLRRAVTLYERTPEGLKRLETPGWLATTTLFSGGGGLWSTADDYLRFAQMLVGGGQLGGVRLLSPRTIDLMASNHVGALYTGTGGNVRGMGFGLSVDVVVDHVEANARKSSGSFGWGGAFGTYFWVDRKEQLVAVMMIQTPAAYLRRDFENAVMQAVVE